MDDRGIIIASAGTIIAISCTLTSYIFSVRYPISFYALMQLMVIKNASVRVFSYLPPAALKLAPFPELFTISLITRKWLVPFPPHLLGEPKAVD